MLDSELQARASYAGKRKAKADALREKIAQTDDMREKLAQYISLAEIETDFMTDSAISAYNAAIELSLMLGDMEQAERLTILRCYQYLCLGLMHEGMDQLHMMYRNGIFPSNEVLFHRTSAIIFVTLGTFYEDGPIADNYMKRGLYHARKCTELSDPESPGKLFAQSLAYMCEGKPRLMSATLQDCMEQSEPGDFEHTRAITMLGEYYRLQGDTEKSVNYFAKVALMDIKNADLEGVALLRLGELLYQSGDTERAHRYLAQALESAIKGDMKFNLMRINNAYTEVGRIVESKKYQWIYSLIGFILLLAVTLMISIKSMRDKKRQVTELQNVYQRLANADLAKDTYISEFMNLSSNYMEILEEYNKLCRRKLAAGQTEELMAVIKQGKVLEEARKKFYDVFDEALLSLFPDFVEQINSLLQPDKRIVLSDTRALNTELRIAALARLGIEDVTAIARFLGISTNTIYTYRNRLRTRAIDRGTIEESIRCIGVVKKD